MAEVEKQQVPATESSGARTLWLPFVALTVVYLPVLYDLAIDWYTDPNYSHGFLVPLVSAYLLWERREILRAVRPVADTRGLLLVIAGMILFVVGNAGAEFFTVRLSFLVTLFGLVDYLLGREFVRLSWFELVFLVFMIPIPYVIYFAATFPMQLVASKITVAALNLLGAGAVRQGNIIHIAGESLEVAEACSGMRSLVSLLALGAIYAHLTQRRTWTKLTLFLSTIPIAVMGNVVRVFISSIAAYTTDVDITAEPLHSIMGVLVFVVAFILLLILSLILGRLSR